MTFLGRWTQRGITHAVFRASVRSPYHTLCALTLSNKSSRSVRREGPVTCIICASHDRFNVALSLIARKNVGACLMCGRVAVETASLCGSCVRKQRLA